MRYWYAKPHKLLTKYVRTVLIIEGFSQDGTNNLPVFTNGMPMLFCNTDKHGGMNQLALYGKSPNDIWTLNKQIILIAYFFQPFVLPSLFRISANRLSEKAIELCTWNPHRYNILKAQLIDAKDSTQKLEVLDHLLIKQLNKNEELCRNIQFSTEQILHHSSKEVIAEILKALDLKERTFQRIFKQYVGITATQYRRICQFQESFGQLRARAFTKISEVAYNNGFADQSHFIRSFKEFAHSTPNDYLKKGLINKNL